jgi:hypothetical protein
MIKANLRWAASLLIFVLVACSSQTRAPAVVPEPQATAAAQVTAEPTIIPTASEPPATLIAVVSATPQPTPISSATPLPASPTPPSISGDLAFGRGQAIARPIVVMIDNHPAAYPQIGLDQASLVFEALAEFGITRYMAVYVPGISPETDSIGPVRSARPYFVEWAKGLRGIFVHAGGSPEGLLLAETAIEIQNMDALRRDGEDFFHRSGDRQAPHNLFTSTTDVAHFSATRGDAQPDLEALGFVLKADAPASDRPPSQAFGYFFLYQDAPVSWEYRPERNDYLRFRNNRAHVDGRSGEQLYFKNVIVMEVPERPIPGDSKGRIEQQVIGAGPARLFTDGVVHQITWRKDAGFAPLQFFLSTGEEVQLNVGATWIAAIPTLDTLWVKGD